MVHFAKEWAEIFQRPNGEEDIRTPVPVRVQFCKVPGILWESRDLSSFPCVSVCNWGGAHLPGSLCGGWRTSCGSCFSPSEMWFLGMKLWSSGLIWPQASLATGPPCQPDLPWLWKAVCLPEAALGSVQLSLCGAHSSLCLGPWNPSLVTLYWLSLWISVPFYLKHVHCSGPFCHTSLKWSPFFLVYKFSANVEVYKKMGENTTPFHVRNLSLFDVNCQKQHLF